MAIVANVERGDWQCINPECINHQKFPHMFIYGSKVNCTKCGTGKTASAVGDWCCPNPACFNHTNAIFSSTAMCSRCGTPRPELNARGTVGGAPMGAPSMAPGISMGVPSVMYGSPSQAPSPMQAQFDAHLAHQGFSPEASHGFSQAHVAHQGFSPEASHGFSQEPPAQTFRGAPEMCGDFERGRCQRGDRCRYSHGQAFAQEATYAAPSILTPNARPGDWHCANPQCKNHTGNLVYSSKTACPMCGTPKPVAPVCPIQYQPPPPQQAPQYVDYAPLQPQPFQHGQPPPPSGLPPPGTPQMFDGPSAMTMTGPGGKGRPGDWHCADPQCKNHSDNLVFGSKMQCPICGSPKPAMPVNAPGGAYHPPGPVSSKPPVRPGDWNCPNPECKNHTDNVVFANKPACPLCGFPNPFLPMNGHGGHGHGRARSRSPHRAAAGNFGDPGMAGQYSQTY